MVGHPLCTPCAPRWPGTPATGVRQGIWFEASSLRALLPAYDAYGGR